MAFWDDFNRDPAAYFGNGPSPSNTVRSTEMATNPFGNYFEDKKQSSPVYESRDAAPVMRAEPERSRDWTYDLMEMLKHFSGAGKQGGGPAGATGGQAMAYVPPTGKGGGLDVVKLAMMIYGGAAGGMGGMGGMGGAGGASEASSTGGAGDYMKMAQNMGGGGGGGGASAPPTPPAQPMTMMQLPYMTAPSPEPSGPVFGQNIIPSTLDIWRPRQNNTLFPGRSYG